MGLKRMKGDDKVRKRRRIKYKIKLKNYEKNKKSENKLTKTSIRIKSVKML